MLCQHEDLSSYPQNTCKKSRVVMLSHNPSTGKVETEGIAETQWPASLAESMSFRFKRCTILTLGLQMCTHMNKHTLTSNHTHRGRYRLVTVFGISMS